jgi:sugar fermentation stimulation protein A
VEKREYSFGDSRIDFLLKDEAQKKMLVEVKGCTLVEDGLALFPDAPTVRGKKHVQELVRAKNQGFKSAVLFLIMREDAVEFSPNYRMDPDFSQALFHGYQKGLNIIVVSFKNIYKGKKLNIKPFKRVAVNFKHMKIGGRN